MRTAIEWTSAEQDTLVAMAAAGATAREIGDALGRSRNAIIGRAGRTQVALLYTPPPAREPLPRRPRRVHHAYAPEERQAIRDAYLAGATYREIAQRFGMPVGSISLFTRDLQRRRPVTWSTHAIARGTVLEALTAVYAGEGMERIARRLGVSKSSIGIWRKTRPELDETAREAAVSRIAAHEAQKAAQRSALAAISAAQEADRQRAIAALRVENEQIVSTMPERARAICLARFDGATLQKVGDTHGVTRERVRQIEVYWRAKGFRLPAEKPFTEASLRTIYVPAAPREPAPPRHVKAAQEIPWILPPAFLERAAKRPYRKTDHPRWAAR